MDENACTPRLVAFELHIIFSLWPLQISLDNLMTSEHRRRILECFVLYLEGTTSGKWIEHKHYHAFGGSLLAENVTKQACVSVCKMKRNCKSVDFDVIIKSCWMHHPSPRCTALRRRQNVLHIRTSQCQRRSSDFL